MNNKFLSIILIFASVIWNYWLSLFLLWFFIYVDIIQFKVRIFDAELFAYSNCIILFIVNYGIVYIKRLNIKKLIILSIGYILILCAGLLVADMFAIRYISLICVMFSIFISNLFIIYFAKFLMQKSTRIMQ